MGASSEIRVIFSCTTASIFWERIWRTAASTWVRTGCRRQTERFTRSLEMETEGTLSGTVAAEIPVWIEGKEERIPAGTELVLRAAELPDETGAARAEAELPDGRHCELRIQKDRDQYRFRIGGMDEYDCFESLGYAG